jgi:hypothetical protein
VFTQIAYGHGQLYALDHPSGLVFKYDFDHEVWIALRSTRAEIEENESEILSSSRRDS